MNIAHTDFTDLHRARIVALACVGFAECSLGLTQTTQNSQNGCVASLAAVGPAECTHPGWQARAKRRAKVCDFCAFCVRNKKHSVKKESAKVCGVCVKQNKKKITKFAT